MTEFICLMSSSDDEKMGIQTPDLECKIFLDINQIESFRQSFDKGREIEDNTYVEMKSGNYHCLKFEYEEFKKLYLSKLPEK